MEDYKQWQAVQAGASASAEASPLAAPARSAAPKQRNTRSIACNFLTEGSTHGVKSESPRASCPGTTSSRRSSLQLNRQQYQRQQTQPLQPAPPPPLQGTSLRLRVALIILRSLQVAACIFNGYVSGSAAKSFAAKASGPALPPIVVCLIVIELCSALTAALDITWLMLTWRQDWRHRMGCVAGVQVPPYTADFILDLFVGGSWFAFLISLYMQRVTSADAIAFTCVMTGLHWGSAPFDWWARSAEVAKAARQQEIQQLVQVQVQVQTQGQPLRNKAVPSPPRPVSPSRSVRRSVDCVMPISLTAGPRGVAGVDGAAYRLSNL